METQENKGILEKVAGVEGKVVLRKFDTDDLMTLRNEGLDTTVDTASGKETIRMRLGDMIRYNIVLGIKSAPFFKSIIDEEVGATKVLKARLSEFRKIPPQAVDYLFNEIKDYNSVKMNVEEKEVPK